jgi:hypothetical protein
MGLGVRIGAVVDALNVGIRAGPQAEILALLPIVFLLLLGHLTHRTASCKRAHGTDEHGSGENPPHGRQIFVHVSSPSRLKKIDVLDDPMSLASG